MLKQRYLNIWFITLLALAGCGTSTAALRPTPTAASPPAPAPHRADALAYIARGDLWVRALPDGAAQRLTNDGQAHSPRWSPSGAWLSLCKGDDLWVLRRDGTGARSVGACGAQWLAGDRLSYYPRTDTDDDVPAHILTFETGRDRALAHPAALWSPDGAAYAYVEFALTGKTDADNLPERTTSLWRSNANGSDTRKLLDPGTPAPYGIVPLGWYRDQILYWQNPLFSASLLMDGATLWAVPERGGAPRQVAPAMLTYGDLHALAPDGATLALTVGNDRETWTNKRIATLDVQSDALSLLTDEHTAAIAPAWSPDGQWIAYVALRDAAEQPDIIDNQVLAMQRRIWTMTRDGANQRQLTRDATYRDESPHFSADGTRIVFARFDQQDHASVWMMQADGSTPTQIAADLGVPPRDDAAPAWFGYYGHVDWGDVFDYWPG